MQNHTPYDNWYSNNEFQEANNSNELSGWEKDNTDTYAKGISYTDSATAEFLNSLNSINRPITVVFYGDHLPGIYPNSLNNKITIYHFTRQITLFGPMLHLLLQERSLTPLFLHSLRPIISWHLQQLT